MKEDYESNEANNSQGHKPKKQKWTVERDNRAYKCWNVIVLLSCLYTSIIYPYYAGNQFPKLGTIESLILSI